MNIKNTRLSSLLFLSFFIIVLGIGVVAVPAQTDNEATTALAKGLILFKAERYAEAAPYLETAVKNVPDDSELRFMYGWALIAKSKQTSDVSEAKKLSADALVQLKKAKELGMKEPALDTLIGLLGSGGLTEGAVGRTLTEAEKAFEKAESHFARSEYDEALVQYEKVLTLDPKAYDAAVHAGDAYVAKSDWTNAEKYYQRAISIDPEQERAYRYSATPFMKQKKYDEARDRYVEALIADPYSRMSPRGISQWAEITDAKLGHPKVKFPDANETAASDKGSDSGPWAVYRSTRAAWKKEKFAQAFPTEKSYRHSLKEEADAIRSALRVAAGDKKMDDDLKQLQKMDSDGVLEPYILMALADEGIAQDHRGYWKDNRSSMRKYVLTYVISR